MKKRTLENIKTAKARKQKMVVLGLAAALVLVLAIQAPRLLKKSHSSTSATTPAVTTTTPGTPPAGTAAVVSAPAAAELPESDVPPRRARSQLFSFSHFSSKDPFAQQVTDSATAGSSVPNVAPSGGSSAASSTTATPAGATQTAASPAAAPSTSGGTTSTQKTTAAVIEVNGQRQTVSLSQGFPQTSPTFKLVSLQGGVARIGIAGGSFSSGDPTISLQLGKTMTLMNTTDGQRYELRLVSVR